jgi:hypothetical protein
MSEEQLKAFLEAVKANEGLQEQLKAVSEVMPWSPLPRLLVLRFLLRSCEGLRQRFQQRFQKRSWEV